MPLRLPPTLIDAIKKDPANCILWVGSGLSKSNVRKDGKGLPDWDGLMRDMIDYLRNSHRDKAILDSLEELYKALYDTPENYLEIAQLFKDNTLPDQFANFLKEELDPDDIVDSPVHQTILKTNFHVILTTNCDRVFELQTEGRLLRPLVYPQCLDGGWSSGFFVKVHGCVVHTPNPAQNLVLTKESYDKLSADKRYRILLTGLFAHHTILTVGYSLRDPDFLGLIDDLQKIFEKIPRTIYALMHQPDPLVINEWFEKGVDIIPYQNHDDIPGFFEKMLQLKPTPARAAIPYLVPGRRLSIEEVLESYKQSVKQKREEERQSEFPRAARFLEPPLRLKTRAPVSEGPTRPEKAISKDKEPEFKPVKLKDLLREKGHYALIANSGLGKTTLLKELQYKMVTDELPSEEIPIYFHYANLLGVDSEGGLLEKIRNLFPEGIEGGDGKQAVDALFRKKRFLFLLDGLDQAGDLRNLSALLGKDGLLKTHNVILAGRPYIYPGIQSLLAHHGYLTLDTFSPAQAREYLGEEGYRSLGRLLQESSMRAPMILAILKELSGEIGPRANRTEIYEKMVDKLLSYEVSRRACEGLVVNPNAFKENFSRLSYLLLKEDLAGRFPWEKVDPLLPEMHVDWTYFVRLTHLGIISEVVEGTPLPGKVLEFRHQSFQEYLASVELRRRLLRPSESPPSHHPESPLSRHPERSEGSHKSGVNEGVLIEHLEYRRWDEVLFFLIGSLEPGKAKEIIDFISRYDFLFSAQCIAHYRGDKDRDFKEIIDKLFGQIDSYEVQEALAKIATEGILKRLFDLLKDRNAGVRKAAAGVLGRIGSEKAIPPLVPLLKDSAAFVRSAAAEALGRIGSEKATPHLLPLLKDPEAWVRSEAAEALGRIGSEKATPHLLPLLKDPDAWVRSEAAGALGEIGSEEAIPPLVPLLKDPDAFVRWAAAEALGRIGSEKATPHLLPLLKDPDAWVRSEAAVALGRIGSEKAVEPLVSLLKDPDAFVRKAAAGVLGRIGSEEAVPDLVSLFKDKTEDADVRSEAARVLGEIGSEEAIEPLVSLLKDPDAFVRSAAAEALGRIGSEKAIPPLTSLLKDKTVVAFVRRAAAEALGEISKGLEEGDLLGLVKRLHGEGHAGAVEEIKKACKRRFLEVLHKEILRPT